MLKEIESDKLCVFKQSLVSLHVLEKQICQSVQAESIMTSDYKRVSLSFKTETYGEQKDHTSIKFEPPNEKTNKMTCAQRILRSAWAW